MSDREIMNSKGFNNKPRKDFTERTAVCMAAIIILIIFILSIFLTGCDDNIEDGTTLQLYFDSYVADENWDVDGWNARYSGTVIKNETYTMDYVMWCMIGSCPIFDTGSQLITTIVYIPNSDVNDTYYYTTINGYDVMIIAPL